MTSIDFSTEILRFPKQRVRDLNIPCHSSAIFVVIKSTKRVSLNDAECMAHYAVAKTRLDSLILLHYSSCRHGIPDSKR